MLKKLLIFSLIFLLLCGIGVSYYFGQNNLLNKPKNNQTSSNWDLKKIISYGLLGQRNQKNWTLLLSGDIIPARSVNYQMTKRNDFFWPLRNIAPILQNSDLTLINLEAPLIPNCPLTNEGMIFCGDLRFGQSLVESGVDIVNLSNNHSLNYGWEGIGQTEELLNNLGIETVGFTNNQDVILSRAKNPIKNVWDPSPAKPVQDDEKNNRNCSQNIYCSKEVVKTVGDTKIGFLGYNTVGQKLDRELVVSQISKLKNKTDVVVVSIHWGAEYSPIPKPEAEDPQELGRWFIDQGADIVVGNHPHQIQPYEFYTSGFPESSAFDSGNHEGLILYALGNTVFDQEWSSETKKGILVKLHFKGSELDKDNIEVINISIKDFGESFINQ